MERRIRPERRVVEHAGREIRVRVVPVTNRIDDPGSRKRMISLHVRTLSGNCTIVLPSGKARELARIIAELAGELVVQEVMEQ